MGSGRQPGSVLLSLAKEETRKSLSDFFFRLEILRPAAVGLTSFITERSKQERCHRFDTVDGVQGKQRPLENRLFGDVNRGTASLNAPAVAGTAPCGADSRYDRSGRQAPGPPHSGKQSNVTSAGFYPAHPAGRGCRFCRSGKMKSYRANGLQRKGSSLPQLLPDVSPGLQGKAGSSRGWDGLPSIDGGGLGGLPARAIISRVCAARRSAGNGRSVSKAVPLFTSPIRRFSRGL